jgi:hypothetical protein
LTSWVARIIKEGLVRVVTQYHISRLYLQWFKKLGGTSHGRSAVCVKAWRKWSVTCNTCYCCISSDPLLAAVVRSSRKFSHQNFSFYQLCKIRNYGVTVIFSEWRNYGVTVIFSERRNYGVTVIFSEWINYGVTVIFIERRNYGVTVIFSEWRNYGLTVIFSERKNYGVTVIFSEWRNNGLTMIFSKWRNYGVTVIFSEWRVKQSSVKIEKLC